jgi:hypothetical protein
MHRRTPRRACLLTRNQDACGDQDVRKDEEDGATGACPLAQLSAVLADHPPRRCSVKDAAGLGEADLGALTDGLMARCLRDVCLPEADGPEQDDGLAGVKPVQRGGVADLGGGQLRGQLVMPCPDPIAERYPTDSVVGRLGGLSAARAHVHSAPTAVTARA